MQGHPAVVSLLLSAGASVDAPARDGETPLMHACFNGHISCVELLLSAGTGPILASGGTRCVSSPHPQHFVCCNRPRG
jgi:ankyrin repeat protein